VERQTFKRTRLDAANVEGHEPCITCGKAVRVISSEGPFFNPIEGGRRGTTFASKLHTHHRFVICDECHKDLVSRMTTGELSFVGGSGDLKSYPLANADFNTEYEGVFEELGFGDDPII
jgi:hypothetical protein